MPSRFVRSTARLGCVSVPFQLFYFQNFPETTITREEYEKEKDKE